MGGEEGAEVRDARCAMRCWSGRRVLTGLLWATAVEGLARGDEEKEVGGSFEIWVSAVGGLNVRSSIPYHLAGRGTAWQGMDLVRARSYMDVMVVISQVGQHRIRHYDNLPIVFGGLSPARI